MENVKVSVIVPIYNAENYLEACLKSILEQTFKDFELILVDDGSKDRSLKICETFAESDDRVVVIHQENCGSSSAKNTGLKVANGEYIAFCDADDTIDTDYIQNLYQGVLLDNVDVCIGNFAFITEKNGEILTRKTVEIEKGSYRIKEFMSFYPRYMTQAIIGSPCNKLYKHKIIVDNSLDFNTQLKNNEDTHFNFDFLSKCQSVYVSDKPYYNYYNRINVASASKGYIENIFDIYVLTYFKAVDFLRKTDTYDNNIGFQNQYFIDLIIGAINGIVNGNNTLSKREALKKVRNICGNEAVCQAIKTVRYKNIKKQLMVSLIKMKSYQLIYLVLKFVKK
jgi:glycosyltransferase involved in cell wall biosynthesis